MNLAAEQADIEAGAKACADTCECHGGYVCRRVQHEIDTPHVGYQEDGSPVQWAAGACSTPEDRALAEQWIAEQRRTATLALLDQIDPAVLVEALKARGHL